MKKEKLYVKLEERLKSFSCLSSFYVGVSNDVGRRDNEHWCQEGYDCTFQVVHSNSDVVVDLEKYLIERFLQSDLSDKCNNKNKGGGNVSNANYLYISLKFVPRTIDELDEGDFEWECLEF